MRTSTSDVERPGTEAIGQEKCDAGGVYVEGGAVATESKGRHASHWSATGAPATSRAEVEVHESVVRGA